MLLKRGIFCISIDVELLWGRHDRDWKKFIPVVAQSRSIIKEVLELLEQYKIGATWAIVGQLFLSSRKNRPGWYGRDIVRMVKKYPRQEIACHSFSHIIFGDPGCSPESADSEIKACMRLAKQERIKLTSFVFPRNSIGHLDILKKYGFTAYRGMEANPLRRTKLAKLITLFLPFSPPVHSATNSDGIINIPASMYLPSSRGLRRFIPHHLIVSAAIRGISQAVRERKIFHLWLHPEDLVGRRKKRIIALRKILVYATTLRDQNVLDIVTLQKLSQDHPKSGTHKYIKG